MTASPSSSHVNPGASLVQPATLNSPFPQASARDHQSTLAPDSRSSSDQASFSFRAAVLTYGLACYAASLVVFAYLAAWMVGVGDLTPTSLDALPTDSAPPWFIAVTVNVLLVALFGVQHSVMARPWFKQAWTRIVPKPAERSTYLLFSNLALLVMFWLWQPIGGVIWNVDSTAVRSAIYAAYAAGWLLVLAATFVINHFDLFGLRQVWFFFRSTELKPLPFKTPAMYRVVRHPLYVGWLVVFWAAPTMTIAHLLFAGATTLYILLAIHWEERDLIESHPEYLSYRRRVGMLLPRMSR